MTRPIPFCHTVHYEKGKEEFYLVDLKVLPEAIKKTIKVKELLNDGICGSINEAVKKSI